MNFDTIIYRQHSPSEVRVIATVRSKEAAKFMEDITHWFGVPNRIVTDLGTAFTGSDF
jgi:cobalamin biosynthesis protein CbiG